MKEVSSSSELSELNLSVSSPEISSLTSERTAALENEEWCGFKICGDNIDKTVYRRYLRCDQQNISIHYFHSFALKDRVNFSNMSDSFPTNQPGLSDVLSKLLPNKDDDTQIHNEFAILLSWMLCTHIKFFKDTFADVIDWHIPQKFTAEMSKKSVVVSQCVHKNILVPVIASF